MKKVVAILGDYYHNKEDIIEGLEAAVSPVRADFDINIIDNKELITSLKENPDLLIVNKENRINPEDDVVHTWMNEEVEEAIVDYVKAGGRILAWHGGMALYPPEGSYIQMLRGYFKYHPPGLQEVTYHTEDTSFTIEDEHYIVHCEREQTEVFLTSTSAEAESIGGWQHSFGKGKVCCLTLAHTKEGMLDDRVKKLISEKINWCFD